MKGSPRCSMQSILPHFTHQWSVGDRMGVRVFLNDGKIVVEGEPKEGEGL